jgi:hypothetical protein
VRRGPRPLLTALTVLPIVVAVGCATPPPRVPPVLGGVPAERVDELIRRWADSWERFTGLRAAVDVTIVRRGQAQRAAGALLLSPTRLRFEAMTPIGFPALVATAGPDRLLVWVPLERKAWAGRPTPQAMARWLGVPAAPDIVIRLLAGQVPLPPAGVPVRVAEDRGPHLVFEQGGTRQRVWVTPDGDPARVELTNGQRFTVTFERAVTGPVTGVFLEAPGQSLEARLRYVSGEYVTPPPEAFELTLPPDVAVERLD